ncbi:MAG: MarC family protein [Paracoccaceae bacterium]
MDASFLITAFVSLFVVIDPIALLPLFMALTQGMTARERRIIGARACVVAAFLLCIFAQYGETVLNFVGISMPAFRIAGGILLFITALDMLFERRTKRREDSADSRPDPSVFPLAIPLIAGPGSIATVILLAGQNPGTQGFALVIGVMLTVILVTFIFFLSADVFERVFGKTGINVITRLLGMLLAALAVQFVLDGMRDFGFGP